MARFSFRVDSGNSVPGSLLAAYGCLRARPELIMKKARTRWSARVRARDRRAPPAGFEPAHTAQEGAPVFAKNTALTWSKDLARSGHAHGRSAHIPDLGLALHRTLWDRLFRSYRTVRGGRLPALTSWRRPAFGVQRPTLVSAEGVSGDRARHRCGQAPQIRTQDATMRLLSENGACQCRT
jgi:hypothetical protein